MSSSATFAPAIIAVLFVGFAACGDDDTSAGPTTSGGTAGGGMAGAGGGDDVDTTPPSLSVSPEGDLGLHQAVVVTFDETVDPGSLVLGGALAAASDGGVWSTAVVENDTLTIAPVSSWESGTGNLTIAVDDLAGNTGSSELAYAIRLAFSTFQQATVVIGQPDFVSGLQNQGGSVSARSLDRPYGAPAYDPTSDVLFVPDPRNNRVLAFAGVPAENNAAASFALGQLGVDTALSGTSATMLDGPMQLNLFDNRLVVSDDGNHRIAIYESIPTGGPGTIGVVLGQPDKDSSDASCTGQGLSSPEGHWATQDGKLIVTDEGNHRVLVWTSPPMNDGVSADLVLGQATFTTCEPNDDDQDGANDAAPTARTLSSPGGVWSDGDRLAIIDRSNNRILIWTTFPTTSFQPADVVLGQGDFTHRAPNDADQDGVQDAQPTAATLYQPYSGIWSNGVQLIVSDTVNQRVLIWNGFPTTSFQPADIVLGQGELTRNAPNDDDQDGTQDPSPSARTFVFPAGLTVVRDKLLVADEDNSRFLLFESP